MISVYLLLDSYGYAISDDDNPKSDDDNPEIR